MPNNSITWYVARNHLGEFNRGEAWVDDLSRARLHQKPGPVKVCITKYVKHNPSAPVPELLEWRVDLASAKVMDVTDETHKRIVKAKDRKLAHEQRAIQWKLERLREDEKRLAERRARLMKDKA